MARTRYRRKAGRPVVAVQLSLETDGFEYNKWGAVQRCKQGDWLVDNGGDVYTVDAGSFERTYREVDLGQYVKVTPVWAEVADADGVVTTQEGSTRYAAGDYIVSNHEDGRDSWAIGAAKFADLYEPD
jgi:hypothetical protein